MENCDLVIEVLSGNAFKMCFRRVIILEGVEAPEVSSLRGKAAREKLEELILGKKMYYKERRRDEYGRIIARVRVGRKNINEEMSEFIKKL